MNGDRSYSGGCQCGAVRFRVAKPGPASICHCRMCQKALGNLFAAFVAVDIAHLEWTRGKPSLFRSSKAVLRGFCEKCGTPLTYQHAGGIDIALGAFDEPELFEPEIQYSHHTRLPWIETIFDKPVREPSPEEAEMVSFQHPDEDTAAWPPEDDDKTKA